jgi:hypothetical protein
MSFFIGSTVLVSREMSFFIGTAVLVSREMSFFIGSDKERRLSLLAKTVLLIKKDICLCSLKQYFL